jgi:4-hydroxy-4-methyl-2-oxoglutarate aldolase
MMPIGFRVYTFVPRPDPALVQRFASLHTADISDVMRMAGTMDAGIRPAYQPMKKVVGPAVTVSIPGGSFNMLKIGIQQTRPGDVLVVNACGNCNIGLAGGNVCRGMLRRGLAGLIIDGTIRDVSEIRADGFSVYARGTATPDVQTTDAGEVNVPIACGQVVVNPGDIIVADEDGIVVVPPDAAEEVLAGVAELEARHAALQEVLLRGEVTNIANIERNLRERGCEFIDS